MMEKNRLLFDIGRLFILGCPGYNKSKIRANRRVTYNLKDLLIVVNV